MEQYNKVHFFPWFGDNFKQGFSVDENQNISLANKGGKKILVLGESHYCANLKDDIPELTQNVLDRYIAFLKGGEFEPWMNTFTKFGKALMDKDLTKEEVLNVWNHLAFYNYVQSPLSGPRLSPSDEQFENSVVSFFEVLKVMCPDYIIAWGYRLYSAMPENDGESIMGRAGDPILDTEGEEYHTWLYTIGKHSIPLLEMRHPSASFSWEYWGKIIKDFIIRK